jgi:hypothetical protein
VSAICGELERGDLQLIAAEAGAAETLRRIVAALGGGADSVEIVGDLDELDDLLARYGIVGGLTPAGGDRAYRPNPAASGEHPAVEIWACPAALCSRWYVPRDPVGRPAVPTCAITGEQLRRRSL